MAPASGLQRKAAVPPTSLESMGRGRGELLAVYLIMVSMNPMALAAREAHRPAERALTRTPQRRRLEGQRSGIGFQRRLGRRHPATVTRYDPLTRHVGQREKRA